jgi:CMP-N-acetylneuraminic acid synthetase/RimJ/RimL family protein N-acetyltransferase
MSRPSVHLRPATQSDAALLWKWRNDPETRRASFDEAEVALDAHERWLAQTLARADRRLYVVTCAGAEVATARLDIAGADAEVSLTVVPEQRGRGLGTATLEALAEEAFGGLGLRRLVARIKGTNPASRAAFERAGFALVEDGAVLTLVRERRPSRGRRVVAPRLALIPARGGSKRFPRKNLAVFDGMPLLERVIETARAAGVFDRTVVSTEDPEIALLAKRAGAEVHERPPALASDTARLVDVSLALLDELEAHGERYGALCLLLPTSPFREPRHIRESLEILETRRANAVMSVSDFPHVPFWAVREVRGSLQLFWGRRWLKSRTALPRLLRHNGVVLWTRVDAFRKYRDFYCPRLAPYHMGLQESVDIDEPLDLEFAEFLRRRGTL